MELTQIANYIAILVTIVIAFVLRLVMVKIGSYKLSKLKTELSTQRELAKLAVTVVQQVYLKKHGEEKVAEAIRIMTMYFNKFGIKCTNEQMRCLIEEALLGCKKEFKDAWDSIPPADTK